MKMAQSSSEAPLSMRKTTTEVNQQDYGSFAIEHRDISPRVDYR